MNCEDIAGNPWASFNARERSVQKCANEIIDNRFPNNFKRSSSIVICNLCQVLILKSQTLHHFKTLHNKKITKKNSKFIIPYNAIEFYDFICECKTKKIILPKKSTKNGELFPLNKQKSDLVIDIEKETIDAINRKSSKQPNKPIPISDESIEEAEKENNIDDKSSICRDFSIDLHIDKESIQLTPFLDKYFEQDECKPISQKSILNNQSEIIDTRSSKMNNELKLNIKIDSNGILTSSFIGESNIFDRMSNLCDNRHCNTETSIKNEPILKQVNDDKTYDCTVFFDEYNNSILIDNDKDESEDFDSSISNDSAYYSLPNKSSSSVNKTSAVTVFSDGDIGKCLIPLTDASVAPPLVTACQFTSSSVNTVSYNECSKNSAVSSNSETTPTRLKSTSVTSATNTSSRNSSTQSNLSTKSNVKHRFYVSSHGNQNILESIRKNHNFNGSFADGLLKESGESCFDLHSSGTSNGFSSENKDFISLNNNTSTILNNQLNIASLAAADDRDTSNNSFNSCDNRTYIRQPLWSNSYWDCIQETGIKNNLLIPKQLSWNYIKHRCKTIPQLHTKKSKYSSDSLVHHLQFNTVSQHSTISDNPLLSSYTIYSTGNEGFLQSNLISSPSMIPDNPFPDRNQMSFQQRLLERGVISQRDIARSQRCFSLNNNTFIRKHKSNSGKPTYMDCKRMLINKTCSMKNSVSSFIGSEISGSQSFGKTNFSYFDPNQKDNQISRTTMLSDNNFDGTPNSLLNNQRNSWNENSKLSRIYNVNTNISSFQGLYPSQNYKLNKPNGTIIIGSNSNLSTFHSHVDNKSETLIPSYKFQSDFPLVQINNKSLNTPTFLSNDGVCFSQPFSRKYINHQMSNGINRYNGCTQNYTSHSKNVIHSNTDR